MIRSLLRGFFKTLYAFCAILGVILILLGFFIYKNLTVKTPAKPLSHDSVIFLTLEGEQHDQPLEGALSSLIKGQMGSIYKITSTLKRAAHDQKVKGLIIHLNSPAIGLAQIQELRDAFLDFRKAGKFILFYADSFGDASSTGHYYLATAADEIWIQPVGTLNCSGLNVEVPFAKEALDKLQIKPEFGQRKEYKSYVETFTRENFSEPAKEALQAILDSLSSQIIEGIAQGRNIPHDKVREYINNGMFLAREAFALKLIDKIDYRYNLKTAAHQRAGKIVDFISFHQYASIVSTPSSGQKVALIFGEGPIAQEKEETTQWENEEIGSNHTYKIILHAIEDKDVKAIVYRIDSPGGDPTASETISSALQLAKEKGKPVVISMGNYAASGGYWISLAGNKIVAQPGTITGSIGVFSGKFVLSSLWEKLGIKWGHLKTSENADMWSSNVPFSAAAWLKINSWLDEIYAEFTKKVAHSRHLSPEQVEKIARGRVWTGEQALALGLVDQLGGIENAVALAKKEAQLPKEAETVIYPKPKTMLEVIMTLFNKDEEKPGFLSAIFSPLKTIHTMLKPVWSLLRLTHQEVLEMDPIRVE